VPLSDQGGVTTHFSLTPDVPGIYSVYQNIVYECGGGPSGLLRMVYSEAFPVGGRALSEQRDDMFIPWALRKYRFRARTWLEKGPIASSYRRGRVYGSGRNMSADRMTPWGVARGRREMRVVPPGVAPLVREILLQWDDGIMRTPIESACSPSWSLAGVSAPTGCDQQSSPLLSSSEEQER
jgi:hypothetical protein